MGFVVAFSSKESLADGAIGFIIGGHVVVVVVVACCCLFASAFVDFVSPVSKPVCSYYVCSYYIRASFFLFHRKEDRKTLFEFLVRTEGRRMCTEGDYTA